MAITEFSFSIDDFQNPKKSKDPEAISTLLVRLLLLEPGTIQSHPDIGVGLVSKYRFGSEGISNELRSNFQKQIEIYLPQFQGTKVDAYESDGALKITAQIDDTLYGIYYDINTSKISSSYTSLSNL